MIPRGSCKQESRSKQEGPSRSQLTHCSYYRSQAAHPGERQENDYKTTVDANWKNAEKMELDVDAALRSQPAGFLSCGESCSPG